MGTEQRNTGSRNVRWWEEVELSILPRLVDHREVAHSDLANSEWVNGLHIVYDIKGAIGEADTPVTVDHLARWHISPDDLHERAIENLTEASTELTMEVSRAEGYIMLTLTTPDPYNASRILLPSLHWTLREHLGQTFYAAIPHRRFLAAFSTKDASVLSRVRSQVLRDFATSEHNVSHRLFVVTRDGVAGDPETN